MNPTPNSTRSLPWRMLAALGIVLALFLASCGDSSDESSADTTATDTTAQTDETTATDNTTGDTGAATPVDGFDTGLFFDGAISGEPATEDCTLSGGTETTCYRLTVAGSPISYETGPFCPETIEDSAEAGGIWFDGDGVYDLDGEFIANLAELYGDDNWQMYDEDGNVYVTETAEEFEAAARPDVDESLQNHCVEGKVDYLENGEPIESEVLIPAEPVPADEATTSNGNTGVTLDGVVIAPAAPVDAILGAYTIAAFDDCGGHFNPVEGYHLHGAVGCSEVDGSSGDETPMFAYAMDGYPVHSPLEDPDSADLDECNGHETDELGYHYHANNAAENQVLECFMGETSAEAEGDAGGGGGPPGGGPPDGGQGGPPAGAEE